MPYKDPEKYKAYQKAYRGAYNERNKEALAAKRADPVKREKQRAYVKEWHNQAKYGLSTEEAEALRASRNSCDICGGPPNGPHGKFVIDHNHDTGRLRGILCNICNQTIGHLKDSPAIALRAAEYLSYYEEIADGFEIQQPESEG